MILVEWIYRVRCVSMKYRREREIELGIDLWRNVMMWRSRVSGRKKDQRSIRISFPIDFLQLSRSAPFHTSPAGSLSEPRVFRSMDFPQPDTHTHTRLTLMLVLPKGIHTLYLYSPTLLVRLLAFL